MASEVRPGRPRKLDPDAERVMVRKWLLHKRLSARNLAREYGLSLTGFYEVVNGRRNYRGAYEREKLKALKERGGSRREQASLC